MAMYYYACKISAVACGARCKHNSFHRSRSQKERYREKGKSLDNDDDDDDKMTQYFDNKSTSLAKDGAQTISGSSNELPEVTCKDAAPTNDSSEIIQGPNGILYKEGAIISAPLEQLIIHLLPPSAEHFDQDFTFSFLLSSRLFIRPHELLGKLLLSVPESESLDQIVGLLKFWTKIFPYDFRDERIMCHVKHIVARCADTRLGDVVSELLRALLSRLTDLEHHEEELRACQITIEKTEPIVWPAVSQLAQILCRIERKLARHIGPEEFMQCNANALHDSKSGSTTSSSSVLNPKKTCNLESYLDWSARLKLFVANEVLQCSSIRDRSKIVELWSGAAQYCLLVGNYNSATAILESLDTPPITRLKATWSKLSSTCHQLDCMHRSAEGCGDLWTKQTLSSSSTDSRRSINNGSSSTNHHTIKLGNEKRKPIIMTSGTATSSSSAGSIGATAVTALSSTATSPSTPKQKPSNSEWVVIPIFSDIVRLAITAREDCSTILPNGHLNIAAFDRLAAIVGAFTRHMCEVNAKVPDVGEYEYLCRHIQSCTLISQSELMLASFDCEGPTIAEKKDYGIA